MSAHTPGPWHKEDFLVYALHEHKGRMVNRFSAWIDAWTSQGGTFEEADANANLISAAPDLLEALEKAVKRQGFTNEELINARAAIAKAKGGTP